jgi:site-specific recombinase XerC
VSAGASTVTLIDEFCNSLAVDRGLQPCTIDGYRRFIDEFLRYVGSDNSVASLSRLRLEDVDGFIVAAGANYGRRSMGHACTAVRGLLRVLYRTKVLGDDLSTAVISPWFYALERLPRASLGNCAERPRCCGSEHRNRSPRPGHPPAPRTMRGVRRSVKLRLEDIAAA